LIKKNRRGNFKKNEFPPVMGVDEEGTEEDEVEGCGPLDSIAAFG
jgi:hypothetical protein